MPKERSVKSSHKGENLLQYSPHAVEKAIVTYTQEELTATGRKKRGYKVSRSSEIFYVTIDTFEI